MIWIVRFVDAIYRFARENNHVYDVTVEDPDDDFQFVEFFCVFCFGCFNNICVFLFL